jgi:release factor glutamine methyltransferase
MDETSSPQRHSWYSCDCPEAYPVIIDRTQDWWGTSSVYSGQVLPSATETPLTSSTGTQPFGPLSLLTRPPVLIPRPETEHWAIQLSDLISPTPENPVSVLDLCTGSGCIPLLLCHVWPKGSARAYGVDISSDAIQLAKDNADRIHIANKFTQHEPQNVFTPFNIDIRNPVAESLLADIGPFDVVTSNPPYIPKREYDSLPSSVKDFEDPRALLGGDDVDGLTFYRAIARLLGRPGLLNKDALIALEVGDGQAQAVKYILETEARIYRTEIWLDPWAKQRAVVGRK